MIETLSPKLEANSICRLETARLVRLLAAALAIVAVAAILGSLLDSEPVPQCQAAPGSSLPAYCSEPTPVTKIAQGPGAPVQKTAKVESRRSLSWPAVFPIRLAGRRPWSSAAAPLESRPIPEAWVPRGGTLGPAATERTRWRLSTVIVRSEDGWGSGALVEGGNWVLTNYHVVEGVAQKAAAAGTIAKLPIIFAHVVDGRTKPLDPVSATLYRVDPVHDLALLKLDRKPERIATVPSFAVARSVDEGEECFVVGSQNNGPAWWLRSGEISHIFDFPSGLSQRAALTSTASGTVHRGEATVIVTNTSISPGDSGGPLINPKGELIGITFATPANVSGGSTGWHVALRHVRDILTGLPPAPEPVPFDTWNVGLPGAVAVEPQLVDTDQNGRPDLLTYPYVMDGAQEADAIAVNLFMKLSREPEVTNDSETKARVPYGLWGMDKSGAFRFDLFVTLRKDGLTAVGYTGKDGLVDDIRIGGGPGGTARLVWRRDGQGRWKTAGDGLPMLDEARLGPGGMQRADAIYKSALEKK